MCSGLRLGSPGEHHASAASTLVNTIEFTPRRSHTKHCTTATFPSRAASAVTISQGGNCGGNSDMDSHINGVAPSASMPSTETSPEHSSSSSLTTSEIFSQAAPMPWSLSPEDRRRWTCAKWIVDILVEWGPLWGLNFISKFENRDVLLSLLNALSTWLEEDPRHERVSTGDGYEYSCVRCPDFLVRPSNTDIDIRRCLPSRPPLGPPRAVPAVADISICAF